MTYSVVDLPTSGLLFTKNVVPVTLNIDQADISVNPTFTLYTENAKFSVYLSINIQGQTGTIRLCNCETEDLSRLIISSINLDSNKLGLLMVVTLRLLSVWKAEKTAALSKLRKQKAQLEASRSALDLELDTIAQQINQVGTF